MYDRTDIYNKHIKKQAEELDETCKAFGVASFMTFCVHDTGRKTEYRNFVNGSTSNGFILTDDRIRKHINVANGFETVPPDGDPGIDSYMDGD